MIETVSVGSQAYEQKNADYFQGARSDFIDELPESATARILEIGCAAGGTGALALSKGKCGSYHAVEINEVVAAEAKGKLTEVLIGDVEVMALPWDVGSFDVLIMSEVLEHFADPWAVLRKLRPLMKPGALMFCSSPNVSHYRVIKMLWRGDWRLEESGVMDRTHLRWFTPKTYAALLESCGFCIEQVEPVQALKPSQKLRAWLLGGRYYLFIKQIKVRAHC